MAKQASNHEVELEKLRVNESIKQKEIEMEKMKHAQQMESERLSQQFQLEVERFKLVGEGKQAFELVPEFYRRRFKSWRKKEKQCYVVFARELTAHFDRWCSSLNIKTLHELRETIIIEQLKNTMPDRVAMHLSENKTKTVAEAAALADEFNLKHKHYHPGEFHMGNSFGRGDGSSAQRPRKVESPSHPRISAHSKGALDKRSACHYCFEEGHWKGECPLKDFPMYLSHVQ